MSARSALRVPLASLGVAIAAAAAIAAIADAAQEPEFAVDRGRSAATRNMEIGPAATPTELDEARHDLLALVNEARQREGLEPMALSAELELAASRHASDMIARGYFAHESPEGSTPAGRAAASGYRRALVLGETIAYGQRTAEEVVAGWLASPPHRRILLDRRVNESGIGVAVSSQDGSAMITWVELVAASAPAR